METALSVHGPILRTLARNLARPLIVDDLRTWRGIELLLASAHMADLFRAQSQTRTVGVMLPSTGAFVASALGAWMAGKVLVPLNFLLKPGELDYVVRDCGTDIIVTASKLLDVLDHEPRVKRLVRMDALNFKRMPEPRWPSGASDEDLATLLYTSGTTGRPKGVMLTHGNLSSNVRQCHDWTGISSRHVFLGVLPQFHSFGLTALTLLPLTFGCRIVYSARFVPSRIVQLMREHRPTVFVALPSMFGALLGVKDAEPDDFASVEYLVSGGEPLPDAVAGRFRERFGVTINEGYGLTETSPVTNWCRPKDYVPHSVGMPMPGLEQRIVDVDTGAPLPVGREGEVRFRGPNVMQGYYKLAEETRAVFDDEGFFRTGDIGREDEQRRLFITGRLKEMIIVGGENVFPREVEEVLNMHPDIAASGVVGAADDIRGETVVAFVEARDGAGIDESALRSFCRDRLAGYKVPRRVIELDELPRTPTGKVTRRELIERLRAGEWGDGR